MSAATFKRLFGDRQLKSSRLRLRTYSGELLKVLGEVDVSVSYGDQQKTVPLVIVEGNGASLFGRNWLEHFRLRWHEIKSVRKADLEGVLERTKDVFNRELGELKEFQATIHVDSKATPRFCKARAVPYAMRTKVDEELDRLVNEGIVEPVEHAEWAAPIVSVWKPDKKSVRICGDFKQTVNRASKLDKYPIPKVEDLFAMLRGGKVFSKLDMRQAYQQLKLDERSKQYVVINTQRGLFRYTQLPFGIASAPGIFQRVMESVVRDVPGVIVYLDDILIAAQSEEEHLDRLEKVLTKLQRVGLRLKKRKCVFMAASVEYLGHVVDAEGLHPLPEKVRAIQDAPDPRNVGELKSFLGLLSYYSRFLPNMSTVLAPLYLLLKSDQRWCWGSEQQKAFCKAKLILSSQVLVHYDPSVKLQLACDASDYGIGAVLSHKFSDGSEKPIAFMSRTLNAAEKNYSQIEKEALACVVGVTRFHVYLYGRHFTLQTDHKPLMTLFNEDKAVPKQASSRIQRWAWKLAAYEYTIAFRKSKQHANADALSRLPLRETPAVSPDLPEMVLMIEELNESPVSAKAVAEWTKRDPVLSKVYKFTQEGWPSDSDETLKPYEQRQLELSTQDGCLIWGGRVVIPPQARQAILLELHTGHLGVNRMKALARNIVWWPGIDRAIEERVQQCSLCQTQRPVPQKAPLQPWSWPTRPWSRIHIDFAGPMLGKMFLVVIDAHSKWLEVIPMSTSTALTTIQTLRTLFAQFGIPESIVSDNGPQFVSAEFEQFCKRNGIKHIRVAPYHPSSNGLAERAVRIFKEGLKKQTQGSPSDRIARLLFEYRRTPHTTTGLSPAELMFGRPLRSRLSLIQPSIENKVHEKQRKQQETHDKTAKYRHFSVGERVYVKRHGQEAWVAGKIVEKTGPLSFKVENLVDGRVLSCHLDQIRKRFPGNFRTSTEEEVEAHVPRPQVNTENQMDDSQQNSQNFDDSPSDDTPTPDPPEPPLMNSDRRYPTRIRNEPDRYSTTLSNYCSV